MDKFQIIVGKELKIEKELINEKEFEHVFGQLYIKISETAFPSSLWTDFVLDLLNMWTETAIRQMQGKKCSHEYWFMDGPYYFIVKPNRKTALISLYKRRVKETEQDFCENLFEISKENFYTAVYNTVKSFITDNQLSESRHYLKLKSRFSELECLLKKKGFIT